MIPSFSRKTLFLAGFCIIIITNSFILAGVYLNRVKSPLSVIQLTERELNKPWSRMKENSGLTLELRWRIGSDKGTYYNARWQSPDWLNKDKLNQLGFNTRRYERSESTKDRKRKKISKKVFIVLEYNGDSYKKALELAESNLNSLKSDSSEKKHSDDIKSAEDRFKRESVSASRLFAIDAGSDYKKLLHQYTDNNRYIIVPGIVKPKLEYKDKTYRLKGHIKSICVEKIHVPLELKKQYYAIVKDKEFTPYKGERPRYTIRVAYGNRYEPWLTSIQELLTDS